LSPQLQHSEGSFQVGARKGVEISKVAIGCVAGVIQNIRGGRDV
jgi:hypothetical protein